MISDLKIENRQTKQSQIAEFVRKKILSGEFLADDRLPSTQALAKKWQLPKATVHRALSMLVKEGLLSRKPKIGTIVNSRVETLSVVVVYVNQNPTSLFTRLVIGFVEDELNLKNIECRIFYENKELSSFQQIKELAEKRLIQGVILISGDRVIRPKFEKLPIPFTCLTLAQVKNRVSYIGNSMIDNAIKAFKNMGCKKIGLLFSVDDNEMSQESGEKELHSWFMYLKEQTSKNNIEIRNEWTCTLNGNRHRHIAINQYDKFAFDAFNKIWSCDEKPDGLFVYTDDLIIGTLLAIMQKRIRVPEDLKLVFHRNAENNILCPVPCYFVESSVKEMSKGLVQLLLDQFNGKEIKQVRLNYKLHKHKGE